MAAPAEAISNFPQIEPEVVSHLKLVPAAAEAIEVPAMLADELAESHANRFKGQVVVERLQAEDDAKTQFAELVDGSMRTTFELSFDGEDLYGHDGRSLNEVSLRALEKAEQAAKDNPNLQFEVERRTLEREEILLAIDMAKGNGSNTMLIKSDFPSALRNAEEDIGGYNVTRQQAMSRALIRLPNGNILMHSQTLDGSNRKALEAVYAEFGFRPESGKELLGQRMRIDLPIEEQESVMDRVTDAYDREMSVQFGGEWYAGRRPADYRNTYDFVCQQRDLVDACVSLMLSDSLTDSMMYDMAATMEARFKNSKMATNETIQKEDRRKPVISQPAFSPEMLYHEIKTQGRAARVEGKTFSACGSTLKAEELDKSTEDQLESAGYGNRANSEKTWHGGKKFRNKRCVSCEKVKEEVGACHICQDCVKHPKKRR